MDKLIKKVACEISIKNDNEMNEMIETALSMVGKKSNKQNFGGMKLIERSMLLLKDMRYTHSYLSAVDKDRKKGTK